MNLPPETLSFLTALGIGFLIGIVRERLHQPGAMMAGVRTHTVAALMGAVAFSMGLPIFALALGITGLLIGVGYYKSYATDPGMTGEVSLAMTVLLGGLAIQSKDFAAGLGVVIAVLLFLKKPLRKFSQELLTEYELEDALILFAAALIVLPLLPQNAVDPWGALKPFAIWKVVVIIMCTGIAALAWLPHGLAVCTEKQAPLFLRSLSDLQKFMLRPLAFRSWHLPRAQCPLWPVGASWVF